MKKLVFLTLSWVMVFVLLLSACSTAAPGEASSTTQGGITTTTEYNNAGHKVVSEFDENNTLLTKTRFTDDGYITYEYDSHENVIKRSNYNETGYLQDYVEYTYDSQDREISCIIFDKDGSQTHKELTEYAQDGTETINIYDGADELSGTTVLKCNENGDIIEQLNYMADGTLDTRQVLEYDELGNETATFTYNGDGSLAFRSETIFDEDGNFLDHIEYDADGNRVN